VRLIVDRAHTGTPEASWRRSGRLEGLRALVIEPPRKVVVVAPHPDDEVLGTGGLLRHLSLSGVEIEILAVTDGEASHATGPSARSSHLADIRSRETLLALRRLCPRPPLVTRLGLPDGRVGDHTGRLDHALSDRVHDGVLWLAPWWSDGHPDHDACGRTAVEVARRRGVPMLSYLVWAWHWAEPAGHDLPWERCRRFDLDPNCVERKRWAIQAFRSQIRPRSTGPDDEPVLPPTVLAHFHRAHEVFVDAGSS
jgi:LmbE family N-acetylglucosaminyl deacetylase